ncbi:hypothetical protein LBMAG42_05060 [Deltaproteobacteria bacterium]|nr:hypothetical protein LBMAG42_05060 [Deltaproteobacteria bacterium]
MPPTEVPTRAIVELAVGVKNADGSVNRIAEVRAVTAADELHIGMSPQYNQHPNDLVYKLLLVCRCVTRLGDREALMLSDIQALDAQDFRALEAAIYTLTYGDSEV